MTTFNIYDLDVWADGEEGWQVNDWRIIGSVDIEITGNNEIDYPAIIEALKEKELLSPSANTETIGVDWNTCGYELYATKDGCPLYNLQEPNEYTK